MLYTAAWIGLILAAALVEGKALLSKQPGATFSAHIWRWFRVKDPRPTAWVWFMRAVLLGGLIWLTGHLGFGWWSL